MVSASIVRSRLKTRQFRRALPLSVGTGAIRSASTGAELVPITVVSLNGCELRKDTRKDLTNVATINDASVQAIDCWPCQSVKLARSLAEAVLLRENWYKNDNWKHDWHFEPRLAFEKETLSKFRYSINMELTTWYRYGL